MSHFKKPPPVFWPTAAQAKSGPAAPRVGPSPPPVHWPHSQPSPAAMQRKTALPVRPVAAPRLPPPPAPPVWQAKRAASPRTPVPGPAVQRRGRWIVVQPAMKAKADWGKFADAALAKQVIADDVVTAVGGAWAVIVAKRAAGTNYRLNTGTGKYQWVSEADWKTVKAAWLDNTISGLGAEDWEAVQNRFTAHWYTDAGHRRDEYNAYELPTGELHYGVPSDNWHLNFHIRVPVSAAEIARVTPPPPPPPPPPVLVAPAAAAVAKDAWDD